MLVFIIPSQGVECAMCVVLGCQVNVGTGSSGETLSTS